MSKSCQLRLNKVIDFKDHKQLCRLCLRKFENDKDRVKLTKLIDSQYFSLTMVHLNSSSKFSQAICSHCHQFLNEFTIQRNDWIFKQTQLEDFVEKKGGSIENASVFIKEEIFDDPQQTGDVKTESDGDDTDIDVGLNDISSDEWQPDPDVEEPSTSTPKPPAVSSKPSERPKRKCSSISVAVDDASSDDDFQPNLSVFQRCDFCSSSFKTKNMLQTHLSIKHPEKLSEKDLESIKKRKLEAAKSNITSESQKMTKTLRNKDSKTNEESEEEMTKTPKNEKSKTWESDAPEDTSHLTRWQREKHLRVHHCTHCKASFQRPHMLENHCLRAHPKTVPDDLAKKILERYRLGTMKICPECGIELISRKMSQHILKHKAKKFSCDSCDFGSVRLSHMRAHVRRHIKKRENFMCHLCPKKYVSRHGLEEHILRLHTEAGKIYKCQNKNCGKEFDKHWKLHKHKYYECGKEVIQTTQCPHCSKEVSKKHLGTHLKVDFEDRGKIFECTECNQKFPNKRCFKHHQMLHKGEVIYCEYQTCNKCFSSQAAYARHQEIHEGIKNYRCPYDGCDKTFAKTQTLKNHIASKHENFKKKCPVDACPYETGFVIHMKTHIVKKHPELRDKEKKMYLDHVRNLKLLN